MSNIITPDAAMWAISNTAWRTVVDAALNVLDVQQHQGIQCNGIIEWAERCATVRLDCGKHTGLTTWIAGVATTRDLIICNTLDDENKFKRTLNPASDVTSVDKVHTITTVYHRIYVDGASRLTPSQVTSIYSGTAKQRDQRWLLLG